MTIEELRLCRTLTDDEQKVILHMCMGGPVDVEEICFNGDSVEACDGKAHISLDVLIPARGTLLISNDDFDWYKKCKDIYIDFEKNYFTISFDRLCEDMIRQRLFCPERKEIEEMGLDATSSLDEIAERYNEYVDKNY